MDRLIELHQQHDKLGVLPHIEAAWIHHAFTQIHPFQDGNGRVARAIATLIFIKKGFFPLVVRRDDREVYIDALKLADHGDLSHLVGLFGKLQKRSLTKAIGKAVDIKPVGSVEEALAATRDMLINLGKIIPAQYLVAKSTANALFKWTGERLDAITRTLANDITKVDSNFAFQVSEFSATPMNELRSVAEKLQYDPNVKDYHKSVFVSLTSHDIVSRIVFSFHSVGSGFRGLVVAVAYFQTGDGPAVPVSDDVFRISYEEAPADVEQRYGGWLDQCLMKGLAEWRRTLI